MARLARVVVPGYPHHITQQGNRRLPTFFCEEDYEAYLALMADEDEATLHAIRLHGRTGRPLGEAGFVRRLERRLGRRLLPGAPGRPPKRRQ